MKGKRRLYATIAFLLALVFLLLLMLWRKLGREYDTGILSDTYVGTEEVGQELGFDLYTSEDWEAWFLPYHKDYLTGEMLEQLLERLGVSDYIEVSTKKGAAVSRAEWSRVYEEILSYLDMKQEVRKNTILVLDKLETGSGCVLISNQGDYLTSLPEAFFENWMAYEIYFIGDNCVGVSQVSETENEISNVYLKNVDGETIDFLFSGAEYEKNMAELTQELETGVCDLLFTGGELSGIRRKQDTIKGEMISYDDSAIEIREYGKIRHTGKIPVYRTYGEVTEKSISDVILGNMELEYVTGGDEVCAILIRQPASIENIRVLLLAEDGTKYRDDVYLKANEDAVVKAGDREQKLEAGEILHVAEKLEAGGDTLSVTPEGSGKVYICDSEGNPVSNGYYGVMEARAYKDGYTLVNQLPFEQYLYAVVPSEMPASYEPEALKAQAVCARSYAYIQLIKGDLAAYGAHIDDSTSYQVYNKVAETEESITAVDETHGQVLSYQGDILEAYYFSTSAGYTDTAAVWNAADLSGYGYLQAFCLNAEPYGGDLSSEEGFAAYIGTTPEGYDSDVRYYRWQVTADYSDKTDVINEILAERHSISPDNILYRKKDGTTEAKDTSKMGKLKKISVEERSASGSILTLRLTYKKGIVFVKTEYNIRKILGAGAEKLVFGDGTEGTVSALLPSAFTTVTPQEDGTYLLCGGGYGHGLGMSQNGANGMAKAGMNYEDILHSFYKDVELTDMEKGGEN
ncbi:MAG: SpoIID/LytB domain-containing protein [Roseburia sp.]